MIKRSAGVHAIIQRRSIGITCVNTMKTRVIRWLIYSLFVVAAIVVRVRATLAPVTWQSRQYRCSRYLTRRVAGDLPALADRCDRAVGRINDRDNDEFAPPCSDRRARYRRNNRTDTDSSRRSTEIARDKSLVCSRAQSRFGRIRAARAALPILCVEIPAAHQEIKHRDVRAKSHRAEVGCRC